MIPAVLAAQRGAATRSRGSGGARALRPSHDVNDTSPGAQLILGFASFGLIAAGIWYLTGWMLATREHEVHEYSQAIDMWYAERRSFEALHASATACLSASCSNTSIAIELGPDETVDANRDEANAAVLPSYPAMAFRTTHLFDNEFPPVNLTSIMKDAKREQIVSNISLTFKLGSTFGSPAVIDLGFLPLLRVHSQIAPGPQPGTRCRQMHGVMKEGRCWIASRLQQVCIQVAQVSDEWRLAPRTRDPESYGCSYQHGIWGAATYQPWPLALSETAAPFENVSLAVRSAHDPFFRALELTAGSLDFGMPADDDRLVGLVMLAVGLALAVPLYFAVASHCRTQDDSGMRQAFRIERQEQELSYVDFDGDLG